MTKFTKVLSPSDIRELTLWIQDNFRHSAALIRHIEQSVLAKLSKQKPVAYLYDDEVFGVDSGAINGYIRKEGQPLYAHPIPHVSEDAESDTQTAVSQTKGMNLGERIAHVGGRENDNGYVEFGSVMAVHALISHVIRDLWGSKQANLDSSCQEKIQIISLLKSLRLEFGAVGTRDIDVVEKNKRIDAAIEAIENHIPDTDKMSIPEGYTLVPIEPTKEMHHAARDWSVKLYGKAIGFEASHGCYKAVISAAPKYTGDK